VLGRRKGAVRGGEEAAVTDVSGVGECAQVREELGVYLVGAIDPGDRARVKGHLTFCARCRDELAGLAGLPGMLRRIPADEAMRAWTD